MNNPINSSSKTLKFPMLIICTIVILYFGYYCSISLYMGKIDAALFTGAYCAMAFAVAIMWTKMVAKATVTTEILDEPTPSKFPIYEPSEIGKQYHALPSNFYVYILQDIDVTGYCKIGRTTTLYKRIHDIGVKVPFRTRVIHIIHCEDMNWTEKMLHARYAKKRVNGEWFNLDIIDVEYLKTIEKG